MARMASEEHFPASVAIANTTLLTEQPGSEVRQVIPPVSPNVPLLRLDESVLDLVLVQYLVQSLVGCEQSIQLPDVNEKELELLVGPRRIGQCIPEDLFRVHDHRTE